MWQLAEVKWYRQTMADSNVAALQAQLNRYAPVIGIASLGVDGIIGSKTSNATLQALAYVANADPNESDTATGLVNALVGSNGSVNQSQIVSSAKGLSIFLGQEADVLGLQQALVASGGGIGPTPTLNPTQLPGSGGAANLLATFKNMPTWQKVAGGLLLGGLGIYAFKKYGKTA